MKWREKKKFSKKLILSNEYQAFISGKVRKKDEINRIFIVKQKTAYEI